MIAVALATLLLAADGGDSDEMPPIPPFDSRVDPLSKERMAAEQARLDYEVFRYDHAKKVFESQRAQTSWVFYVVNFILAFGLLLTGVYSLQKKGAVALAKKTTAKAETKDVADDEHHVTVGLSGISVSTRALGVVVLALSLGFFYLYLRYVYPISNVTAPESIEQTKSTDDK